MGTVLGFNKGNEYQEYTRINISMNQSSNLEDIKQIMNENYSGKYDINYTNVFNDTVSIRVKNISEEEINTLSQKLTEKYAFEEGENNITVVEVPAYRTIELVKPYVVPMIVSFLIVLVYFVIAFRKLGIVKTLVEPVIVTVMVLALYASIFAITRLPITEYIIPLGVVIYAMTLLYLSMYLNKEKRV